MHPPLLCPTCRSHLPTDRKCASCGHRVSLRDGVYEFTHDTYATSFGEQWNAFARTQLDSANGTTISEDRFAAVTGWAPKDLSGKSVLDVGCGAGRFTEVAVRWGAHVTALDLSSAVYAASRNVAGADCARFVHADALAMPFAPRSFDFAFSIGVAQHTPDPLAFVRAVGDAVKPGGRVALWIYERRLTAMLHPKYLLRPLTSRMSAAWNRGFSERLVDLFFPLAERLVRLPEPVRRTAMRALPIAVYLGKLDLQPEAQRQWSLLDTLDWYSPRYDQPQRYEDVARVLRECGAVRIDRRSPGGVTVHGSY